MQSDVDLNQDEGSMESAGQGLRSLERIGEVKKEAGHRRGEGWWEGFNLNGEVSSGYKTDVGGMR